MFRLELAQVRERIGEAIHRRAGRTFEQAKTSQRSIEPLEQLIADGRRLRGDQSGALRAVAPTRGSGGKAPHARSGRPTPATPWPAWPSTVSSSSCVRSSRCWKPSSERAWQCQRRSSRRAASSSVGSSEHLQGLEPPPSTSPDPSQIVSGEAYSQYRQIVSATAPDGETQALAMLSQRFTDAWARPRFRPSLPRRRPTPRSPRWSCGSATCAAGSRSCWRTSPVPEEIKGQGRGRTCVRRAGEEPLSDAGDA